MVAGSIGEVVRSLASTEPDRAVLHTSDRRSLTAREFHQQVVLVATQLAAAGASSEHPVAIVHPDGPELVTALLGTMSVTAAAPLNTGLTAAEIEHLVRDLGATVMLVPETGHPVAEQAAHAAGCALVRIVPGAAAGEFRLTTERGEALPEVPPAAGPLAEQSAESLALLLHTSGTTARPKLVGLRQLQLLGSASQVAASLALSPTDRSLVVMPLFHVHGIVAGLLAPLVAGGEVVVPGGFTTADLARLVRDSQATWLTAVPTMLQALLEQVERAPIDHHLRAVRSCSSALPPSVATGLEERLGVPVIEAYGMTEGAHQIASNPLPPAPRKLGSVGLPTGPELAVVDEHGRSVPRGEIGEVVLRGGSVITGYLHNPDADAESFRDGWFRTGDLGRVDDEGYVFLTGRAKELVNRAGEKISPREVEEALLEHPAVSTAVVFGVADERLGEQVAAAVVLHGDGRGGEPSERDLRMFVAERLAAFKVPRRIAFRDAIPKGPTGKLQRRGLADLLDLVDLDGATVDEPARPPEGPVEETLAELWAEVLHRPVVNAHARFLEVGGDSLAAARLLARVRHELDLDVSMIELFDAPTVAAQAALLEPLLLED